MTELKHDYIVGIDVGSTTTKIVLSDNGEMKYHKYIRHFARQRESIINLINELISEVEITNAKICLTGSGARNIANKIGVPFTQEVVANSLALKKEYKKIGTAIELGGQDAKIIFFKDNDEGEPEVYDMRMNGSCAGGTGAFIDEVATVLGIDATEMNALAMEGSSVYDISGRCGVFAKTDIQALLNQGVKKSDIALSSYHAIAKQTIGGLSQGLDIKAPVAFEGGPLTFHPRLGEVFKERLELTDNQVILPKFPEIMVAYGATLSLNDIHREAEEVNLKDIANSIANVTDDEEEIGESQLYFNSKDELNEFKAENKPLVIPNYQPSEGEIVNAYLGIDSGSTTTKLVLMNENEEIIDSYYSSNGGNPLPVAKQAILDMYEKYNKAGAKLNILSAASTGYGEFLFNKAFRTETHVVETVAHALASSKYVDNPSFILDIGGQDMKAIWLENGIITNIVVNEACSSGCGSFLENFASTLGIKTTEIADSAFSSENPAKLGSRCTVFMNSSIITEQRNGKQPNDIMAGLCRSIIENVFTKVIRVQNIDSLGEKIVVQGGTFRNDAVLRAMEQYVGRKVIRAPFPGLMGAIGSALRAKEASLKENFEKTFISYDELKNFTYSQEANSPCPYCTNHCNRTILTFSTGDSWVTNNRCEKGEVIGNPKDETTINRIKEINSKVGKPANLFADRDELLFKEYPYTKLTDDRDITIGIPRVLSFYEGMPFWTTFFKSLGFNIKISPVSTRKIYENGLHAVPSDTECFPAKLVHGHIRELVKMGVDRIFMPIIAVFPSDNTEKTSFSRCALVKGYPIVIDNSDNTEKNYGVKFDAPYFYWYCDKDREKQLCKYMKDTYGIATSITKKAVAMAALAQDSFSRELKKRGQAVLEQVTKENKYAVVMAARPYHSDPLVNHELPELFVSMGVPVLTVDSIDEFSKTDLSRSRLDVVNNFHARVLGGSIIAAKNENLEFVQIVSFGCGHDACLSDEAVRLMKEISNKAPLILKLDESDAQGPLRIRVRSFVETIALKRSKNIVNEVQELKEPYPVKFTKKDVKEKVVLVPNSSHAFCQIMSAAMHNQNIKAIPLEIGREEAIRLGKKYTHNDICFPAQIVVGEVLAALESGKYDLNNTAVATAKYVCCCRLTHYAAILRKSLDDAGYQNIPILTNDDVDYHMIHPGFKMNAITTLRIAVALPMIDTLEEVLRKIRPYEKVKGSADKAFNEGMEILYNSIIDGGVRGSMKGFKEALKLLSSVEYDDSVKKPKVLIVGEYLLNFHPGANHDIERYLEANNFEIIEAKMTDVIQKSYYCQNMQYKEFKVKRDFHTVFWMKLANGFFEYAQRLIDKLAKDCPLHEKTTVINELGKESDPVIHHTFDTGEGILIPAEIIHNANKGCKNFVILQPFGCLPNHVIGRGVAKKFKEMFPDIEVLPLDYDPDVSFANLENRLQMLIMNQEI